MQDPNLDFPLGCVGAPEAVVSWFLSCNQKSIFFQKRQQQWKTKSNKCKIQRQLQTKLIFLGIWVCHMYTP
jgi:hypothetical protein